MTTQSLPLPHFILLLLAVLPWGCAKPSESRSPDLSRQAAPIPACVQRLPGRGASGVHLSLKEEQYWQLVFPSYDPGTKTLANDATVCTGEPIFSDPRFLGSQPKAGGHIQMQEGDVAFGGGGARLKLIWFRTHASAKEGTTGPLAIVRAQESRAEVYAVGVYAGSGDSRLGLERIGPDLVATALDEGCAGRQPGKACDSLLHVFQPWKGKLEDVALIPLERVRYEADSEPGVKGTVEYKLVSTPEYKAEGIKVLEQIVAADVDGRELRRAEQELWYRRVGGKLQPSGESLWQRVHPEKAASGKGKGTTNAAGKDEKPRQNEPESKPSAEVSQ